MTDQIELPSLPASPPIVTIAGTADAPVILTFSRSNNEMLVNLEVRDEDLVEPLKVRWRIVSQASAPGTPENQYSCPEPTIEGNGVDLRRTKMLSIQGTSFARGKCSRVDVIVSGSFKNCRPEHLDDWDNTTQQEDDDHVGRLSFFVLEESDMPLTNPAAAFALISSCPQMEYTPPSPTASATSAMSAGQ